MLSSVALVRPFQSLPILLLLCLSVTRVVAQQVAGSCTDVHIYTARGDDEGYPGRIGAIVDAVCGGLSQLTCDYEDIQFTSVPGSSYCASIAQGVSDGISAITAYNSRCPNSKLVLAGYSEGAHVVGDILGGGGGAFYDCVEAGNAGISPSSAAGSKIAAAVLFGDPRHIASQSYNVGTGSGSNGQYPRSGGQLAALNLYSANLQNYCLSTDPICALGDDGLSHTTYMTVYAATAGAWIQGIVTSSASSSSANAASAAAAAQASSAAAASASAVAASKAAASASAAAAAASSSAAAAAAAAASASGAQSRSADAIASAASASAVAAAAAASSASAQAASISLASVSQASASEASVISASEASVVSASMASKTMITTYAPPTDVLGSSSITNTPSLVHTTIASTTAAAATTTGGSGVDNPQSTSSSSSKNGAGGVARPTNVVGWMGGLAVLALGAVVVV